jgi:DNA-binding NarL/FixJ family response regulator
MLRRMENTMSLPRVILADDHTMLIEAFSKLLSSNCEIVGTVSDGRALLDVAVRLKPDVIVLDIAMPLLNGLEAARQLKNKMPSVKLVFLTMNEDPDIAVSAMRLGASGYLLKSSAASELFQAIQAVLAGKSYITPRIARGMQEAFIRNPPSKEHERTLTTRQREVMQLLAEGRSMKEAADILNEASRTVAFHKYRIKEEWGLKSNADLIRFAIKSRLIVN